VKAVLLDGLGTLVELRPPAPALRVELRRRCGVELGRVDAERAIAAEIAYYRAHHLEGRDRAALVDLRRRCADVLLTALPQEARARISPADALTALLGALRFRPYPDAAWALDMLRARWVRLVVVSNWDYSLHDVLAATGLGQRVHGVITSAELGAAKPSPAIFAHALTLAGVSAERAIHVGDSVEDDVAGARAAGIEPVLLHRDGAGRAAAPQGVRAIRSLRELPTLAA
jgi:putative hydrolase of the HAD superfamily